MSSSSERLEAVLKWAEERMKQEERVERWQTELDGMLFTNHPGNVIKRAKDMSPDVAGYEQNDMEKETEKFLAIEAMEMARDSLDMAKHELTRAIRLMRKSK